MREFSRRPKCLRRLGTDPIAQYRHRRRDVPGAPPSTATDTLLFVSHTESDRRCVHRQEQFIQDVRIEGRDQGKRNVFSMMNDISFYEPILAMGAEIGCGAIEDKEDEIIIGLDLGRIASNFPPPPSMSPAESRHSERNATISEYFERYGIVRINATSGWKMERAEACAKYDQHGKEE